MAKRDTVAPAPRDALARVLAVRDVSVGEARLKLERLGVANQDADGAIRWALAAGYLDDAKLARRVVEKELARKPPVAPALVAAKLAARGVAADVVAEAVRAAAPREVVREALARWVSTAKLPPRRLLGRLVRAGHAEDDVADLIEAVRTEGVHDESEGSSSARIYED